MCIEHLKWAKEVCFNPSKATKKEMGQGAFMERLVSLGAISGFLFALFGGVMASTLEVFSIPLFVSLLFIYVVLFCVVAVAGPVLSAAITHFFGKFVFRLMDKKFEATYNALSYSFVPRLGFIWIPFVGMIIAGVWSLVVGVYALSNHQKISKGRAFVVLIIPVLIAVFLIAAAVLFGLSTFVDQIDAEMADIGYVSPV